MQCSGECRPRASGSRVVDATQRPFAPRRAGGEVAAGRTAGAGQKFRAVVAQASGNTRVPERSSAVSGEPSAAEMPKVTMSADVETIVVGAGVVGLAVAQALAKIGREVMVLEQHELIGSETSSRNSEVIHAGIYYPPGSLRARLCVRGKHLLYRFCADNRVPHARCGKLLVETKESKLSMMAAIGEAAETNGEADLDVFY